MMPWIMPKSGVFIGANTCAHIAPKVAKILNVQMSANGYDTQQNKIQVGHKNLVASVGLQTYRKKKEHAP
jgi:hypothetical protein